MVSQKQGYIDAVRGWAILLVITCHTGGVFPELPYPIRKLTNFGWHGVQLFFLASAVTLCMSWHNSQERGTASSYAFFVRRFLRIAPMYYVGALIYYIAEPPATGFDGWQLLRSFTFVNAWSPDWTPTTGGWMVVPGGWSIGVEVSFYLIFPILITFITSLARACLLFIVAIAAAWTFNHIGLQMLASYSDAARWNFLYFWFPTNFPSLRSASSSITAPAASRTPPRPQADLRHRGRNLCPPGSRRRAPDRRQRSSSQPHRFPRSSSPRSGSPSSSSSCPGRPPTSSLIPSSAKSACSLQRLRPPLLLREPPSPLVRRPDRRRRSGLHGNHRLRPALGPDRPMHPARRASGKHLHRTARHRTRAPSNHNARPRPRNRRLIALRSHAALSRVQDPHGVCHFNQPRAP